MTTAFNIARVAAAVMLFLALGARPYGYYTVLRFVVCGTMAYGAYFASTEQKSQLWTWTLGIIAVLFNPFILIRLSRCTWAVIDVAVALLLLFSLVFLRERKKLAEDA